MGLLMEKRLRIAYIIPGTSIGGGVNVVLEHASRLTKRGHDVMLLNVLGDVDMGWNPLFRYSLLSKFNPHHLELLRSYELDVIVVTGWQTVFELWALDLKAKSFVYFLQADEASFAPVGSLDSRLARATRSISFEYLTCASWLSKLAPDGRAVVVVNGVNESIFYPDKPLMKKGSKTRVLIEGPIVQPRKRIADAFLACEPYRDMLEVWCVSSGGDPHEWFRPDLFLKKVPMSGMSKVYSSCDFLLKLSSSEGMFGPPLEMMACGGTAVTSDCSGHEEYMRNNYNGLVVPVDDIGAAQAAVGRLIREPDTIRYLSAGGIETARGFSWERAIDKLEKFFVKVSQNAGAVGARTYASRSGQPFSPDLVRAYFGSSYGSLPGPSSVASGSLMVSGAIGSVTNAVRLTGWVSHDALENSVTYLVISEPGKKPEEFVCAVERPDIFPSSPGTFVAPGFDVLYNLKVPREEAPALIKLRIVVRRTFGDGKVEELGLLSDGLEGGGSLIELQTNEIAIRRGNLVGALDSVKPLFAVQFKRPRQDSYRDLRTKVYVNNLSGEGYIFHQPASDKQFRNIGMRLDSPRDGGIQTLSFVIPFDEDPEVVLLAEGDMAIDCVKVEV